MMLSAPLLFLILTSVCRTAELDDVGHEVVLLQQELSLEARLVHDKQQLMDGQIEGCIEDDQNWLFILSKGRSGSTSILEMVNAIPGYFLGGENAGIMSDFASLWQRREWQKHMNEGASRFGVPFGPLAWAYAGEVSDQKLLCDLQAYVRDVIGSPTGEESTPTTLGFKEVRHTKKDELDMFLVLFPNAKFIINVRNASEQASSGMFLRDEIEVREVEEANKVLTEWGRNHSNISFHLPVEEFSVARFNDLLDFLGVEDCRYTQVAHSNDGNTYTGVGYPRDPSTLPGIKCV
jgi:hypothetical protein